MSPPSSNDHDGRANPLKRIVAGLVCSPTVPLSLLTLRAAALNVTARTDTGACRDIPQVRNINHACSDVSAGPLQLNGWPEVNGITLGHLLWWREREAVDHEPWRGQMNAS